MKNKGKKKFQKNTHFTLLYELMKLKNRELEKPNS